MFRHVGIVVSDMTRQLDFYTNILGLEVYYDKVEEGTFLNHILNTKGLEVHIIKLGLKGHTIVELLDFGTPPNDTKDLLRNGYTHFAITVKDIDKLDVALINPPMINDDGTCKVAFCLDYENNPIELVEMVKK